MELLLPIMMTVVSTLLVYRIAIEKGLNVKLWVILAIIFGLLVLPFVFFAKNNLKETIDNKRGDFLEA